MLPLWRCALASLRLASGRSATHHQVTAETLYEAPCLAVRVSSGRAWSNNRLALAHAWRRGEVTTGAPRRDRRATGIRAAMRGCVHRDARRSLLWTSQC